MTLDTYELNDTCPACQGSGSIWTIDGELTCPRCHGSSTWVAEREPDLGPPPPQVEERGWHLFDHGDLIEQIASGEWEHPEPEVGQLRLQTENPAAPKALFYFGRVNSVYGTPDSGKTFTCLVAARQVLEDGGAVMFIDFEDTPEGVYPKLLHDLGVPAGLLDRFYYVVPTRKMTPDDAQLLRNLLDEQCCDLVIVDSTGEGLALDGKNQNADDEVAGWMREVPTMIANHTCQPAVVLIDHLPKAEKGGVAKMPIGSQRKQAVVRGASYHQEEVVPMSRRQSGYATLTCTKDKGGTYAHDQEVARLRVTVLGQPTDDSPGRSEFDLISVDPNEARERDERTVRKALLEALLTLSADGQTAIKGEVIEAVKSLIEVPRGVRPTDVLGKLVTEGLVTAKPCGRDCDDRSHDDAANKRNGNKTHYALPA